MITKPATRPAKCYRHAIYLCAVFAASGCTTLPPLYPNRPLALPHAIRRDAKGARIESYGHLTPTGVPHFGWQITARRDGSRIEAHYAHGVLNGPYRNRYADGDSRIAFYRGGKLHGHREYWYANGRKWQEAELRRGKMDGPGRSWHRNGQLQSVFRFRRGVLVEDAEWDENGKPVRSEPQQSPR